MTFLFSSSSRDWINRLEKDVMQGLSPEDDTKKKKRKRWIHDTLEGQSFKRKLCEWASLRFQALYRTVHGFMQIPRALEVLARIQDPKMSQSKAENMVRSKFSYVMGYQSFSDSLNLFRKTKEKGKSGMYLDDRESDAHETVWNIKYIKHKVK
jgi:hypothetical protein